MGNTGPVSLNEIFPWKFRLCNSILNFQLFTSIEIFGFIFRIGEFVVVYVIMSILYNDISLKPETVIKLFKFNILKEAKTVMFHLSVTASLSPLIMTRNWKYTSFNPMDQPGLCMI